MGMSEKLKHELKSLGFAFLFFTAWIGALMLIKKLILEEYHIPVKGLSAVLLGALVLSKVVLLLEPISLGRSIRQAPAWVGVLARTLLYSIGVLIVLLLEKGLEGRHEYGGVAAALTALFDQQDIYHVWANTICLFGALLNFNILMLVQERLGGRRLIELFTTPVACTEQAKADE